MLITRFYFIILIMFSITTAYAQLNKFKTYGATETYGSDSTSTSKFKIQTGLIASQKEQPLIIWPGDANNSGRVNARDVLYICLAEGAAARPRLPTNGLPIQFWTGDIYGINNVYQDANKDGVIDAADIIVVNENYGNGEDRINPVDATSNSSIFLKPVSVPSISPEEIVTTAYDLILDSDNQINAHGITGTIDLSSILTKPNNTFEIDTAYSSEIAAPPVNPFYADCKFFKYNEQLKTLDYTISKTDKTDEQLNNRPLLRMLITVDQIEGVRFSSEYNPKSVTLKEIGFIGVSKDYKAVNSSFNQYIYINSQIPELNLRTTNETCYKKGRAEICIPNIALENITLQWSNGSISNEISELVAGAHFVNIYYDNILVEKVEFTIKSESIFDDNLDIANQLLKEGKYKALNSINLGMGTEIPKNQTVELTIEPCN